MFRRKNFSLAWLALHFFLISAISVRQVVWLIANRLTIVPISEEGIYSQAGKITSAITGQKLAASNPVKRAVFGYLHGAGIEGASGFFDDNAPITASMTIRRGRTNTGFDTDIS